MLTENNGGVIYMMYINIRKIISFIIIILFLILIGGIGQMITFRGDGTSIEEITKGKYQIAETIGSGPGEPIKFKYALVNNKTNREVGNWLKKYKLDINRHIIHVISYGNFADSLDSEGIKYHILNYNTDECNSYSNLEDMNELDQKIFEDEDNWLIPTRHS